MANLTIIQRSPDPEQVDAQSRTRRSIAEKIRAMGQNRIGALLLLLATARGDHLGERVRRLRTRRSGRPT